MATFRQHVSDILSYLKAHNLDDRLSYRFIISQLKDTASVFLKQDAEYRKLFKINALWRTIKCFDLKEVDFVDCPSCDAGVGKIMKSCKKLPKSYVTTYGHILKIMNLKGNKIYKEIRPQDYRDYTGRKYQPKDFGYFWIDDDYLYIPDSQVESVRVTGIFKNNIDVDKLNCEPDVECISPLDSEFPFPEYIISITKDRILEKLGGITARIVEDEKPNLNQTDKV